MKIFKSYQIVLIILLAVATISCADSNRPNKGINGPGAVRFHSANDPGKWEAKADKHDVDINVSTMNNKKIINVQVPFAKLRNRRHYVEVILLVDANGKELQKKTFKTGYGERGARFEVPEDFTENRLSSGSCQRSPSRQRG